MSTEAPRPIEPLSTMEKIELSRPSLSARAWRREQAELRRKTWRLRWLDLAQRKNQVEGIPVRECLMLVAEDAATLATQNPQLKSEIMRALDQFTNALCAAIIRTRQSEVSPR